MAYVKTEWNPGGPPGISATPLNNLETQYDEVKSELQATKTGDLKPQAINVAVQDAAKRFSSSHLEGVLAELNLLCR